MTAEFESAAYEEPRNNALFLLLPLFVAIAVAAGAWLAGGVIADPAAIIILLVLTLVGVMIFTQAARHDAEGALLFQVLVLAWIARLIGMGIKLYLFYGVVGEGTDAATYHAAGESIAAVLASGQLPDLPQFWGTESIELAAGFLYLITGPTLIGGWLVFNFLGLLGTLLHYKAFVTAVPEGNRRLFMLLVFFAPTLVLWTNTLGKDALMVLFLGMAFYGVALMVRWGLGLGAVLWSGVGLAGAFVVRPHFGAIVAACLVVVALLRPVRAGVIGSFIRIATLAGCVALAVAVVRTSASFVDLEDLTVEGVSSFIQERGEGSEQGSTAFQGSFPSTPQGAAIAVVTVLFRPFPWESGNPLLLASSLEGIVLAGLLLYRWRSVGGAIAGARGNAYLGFIVVFTVIFVFFFSSISNFGILIRQRAQLLPFLFVWLAFHGARSRASSEPDGS